MLLLCLILMVLSGSNGKVDLKLQVENIHQNSWILIC